MTTKADLARFDAFRRIGCIACYTRGVFREADVHHLLSGGRRRGHRFTVPLCDWHHRGQGNHGELLGPSLALTPRKFRDTFGTDAQLLALTDKLIGVES